MFDRREHWETIYRTKQPTNVSWFEAEPQVSLELIERFSPTRGAVIDVGGGASRLVDRLLTAGFAQIAVLDISAAALKQAQQRLGESVGKVQWIVGDVTQLDDVGQFDIWHDRAVFHFLSESTDRRKYVSLAGRTVRSGGHLIIGTFALDGPESCSGLPVCRYDRDGLSQEMGPQFRLIESIAHVHHTPAQKSQSFLFGIFRRV